MTETGETFMPGSLVGGTLTVEDNSGVPRAYYLMEAVVGLSVNVRNL